MRKHIENLKQKPVHVRRRYAAVYTTIIMVVIVTIWVSSFSISKNGPLIPAGSSSAGAMADNSLAANSIGVWGILKNSITSVWHSSDSYKSGDSSSGNIIVTGSNSDKH